MTYTQLVYNILEQVTQYTNKYHDNLNKTQTQELNTLYQLQDKLYEQIQNQPPNSDIQQQYNLISAQIENKSTTHFMLCQNT